MASSRTTTEILEPRDVASGNCVTDSKNSSNIQEVLPVEEDECFAFELQSLMSPCETLLISSTMGAEERDDFFNVEIGQEAKKALSTTGPYWSAVLKFVDWMRDKVKTFLCSQIQKLPVVGNWAARIGTSVTEFCFTVLGTMLHMMKVVFTSPSFWTKAHQTSMKSWTANESNGLMAQTYAYSKKMAGYFLEVLKQCLERAIKVQGLEMTDEEKNDIAQTLDAIDFA